jgi:DNA repair protein RadD
MILRPYQERVVSNVVAALDKHGNTLAVAPTGAGKTIILSAVAGHYVPQRTVILQHRDELVTQNMNKFRQVNKGVPVSIYDADTKSWDGQTTFAMVQTLSRKNNLATMPPMDLLVIDEGHHSTAETYSRIIDRAKEMNSAVKVAGFTATPNRGDRVGLRKVFDNCADQITINELVNLGFLVAPKAKMISLDPEIDEKLSKIRKTSMGEFDMDQAEEVLNVKAVNEAVVGHWKAEAGDRRTIVFCSTIKHAKDVTMAFLDAGIEAALLTGETPSNERAGILADLRYGHVQVVVNVAVLTEGFDEPSVSCIVLLRPCSYKSTMIQMIGRGLRPVWPSEYPGMVKTDCVVLDFGSSLRVHQDILIMVDLEGPDGTTSSSPFKVCPECEAELPAAIKICPFCGYDFSAERLLDGDEHELRDFALVEIDLLNNSPFRWIDLFGNTLVMLACGFDAWVGVVSRDRGETWVAIGRETGRNFVSLLMVGGRTQALAAADDYLRMRETNASAKKGRAWMKHILSVKQLEHLRRLGYTGDLSYNKYEATAHLTFQWNLRGIEKAMQKAYKQAA